jgi:PmbA protein
MSDTISGTMSGDDFEKEIFFIKERTMMLSYSAKSLKARADEETKGYGIRVFHNGGLGFSFASSEKAMKQAENDAMKVAKYSPRPNFSFPEKSRIPKVRTFDESVAEMSVGELKEIFEQVRDGAEKYGGNAQIDIAALSSEERIENTIGFSGSYESSAISFTVQVMDGDGYGFYSNSFCRLKDAGDFRALGESAAEMARQMRNPKKPDPGICTVVFEPESLAELLGMLLSSFDGDSKRRKISAIHDKLGKKVFSEKLSIYDDPLVPYSVSSSPFDDEGVASERRAIVENGTIKNFAYNLETASLEGIKAGGFARRASYTSPPFIDFSNIVVGKGDLADSEAEDFIRVLSFHGSHTANITTGDFGVEVSIAFRRNEALRGFMITGNIFNLFSDIYAIGKKQKNINGFIVPSVAFANVRIVPS